NILSTNKIPENIKVIVNILPGFTIDADPESIKRVFTNIIINAFQAMPEGGTLTIYAEKEDNMTKIFFKDTGAGIPKENLEKIFQPLFTTKAKGTGLGLAVCKRIVEAHNGTIDVESELGKGSTFIIKLPIKS
ncbi:MAG: ATP-binding protein, partial [Nitrososphaeria archaeon]